MKSAKYGPASIKRAAIVKIILPGAIVAILVILRFYSFNACGIQVMMQGSIYKERRSFGATTGRASSAQLPFPKKYMRAA